MKFKELFESNSIYYEILNYDGTQNSFNRISTWFKNKNFRNIRRLSKEKSSYLQGIKTKIENILQYDYPILDKNTYRNMIRGITTDDLKQIDLKNVKIEIETKHGIYYNNSLMNESKFKESIKIIENLFKSLKGFHKKSLFHSLKIKFVTKKEITSKSRYKSDIDELWIRYPFNLKDDSYASLVYMILHELGHRYLKYNKVNFNYDDWKWTTTPYSKNVNNNGEEKFAELFALSHFKYKGKPFDDYKETIDMFINIMK